MKKGAEPKRIVQAAKAYASENEGNGQRYIAYSDNWLENKRWNDNAPKNPPKAKDVDAAAFWAKSVKDGRFIPSTAITDRVAIEMIKRNLVSPADLAAIGVRL